MKDIQNTLLDWFSKHKRDLPWRHHYEPYHVWITEIMMQQTQMDRGVEYYQRWIKQFPNIASVAKASAEKLLCAWEGLGYYKRVKNLQLAAQHIMHAYGGVFPKDYKDILSLPGIGPYTAGAIASIAFNQEVPCIDGNVERVFSRLFDIHTSVKKEPAKSHIYNLVKELIPQGRACVFNQALMEFGALVCRKKPICSICPLNACCLARQKNTHFERPVKNTKSVTRQLTMATGVLFYNDKVFIQRRLPNDIWGDLWEFPGGCVKENEKPEEALVREWYEELGFAINVTNHITTIRHNYTNYHITLHCFTIELKNIQKIQTTQLPKPQYLTAASEYQWISQCNITNIPLPSPHRKLVKSIFTIPINNKK